MRKIFKYTLLLMTITATMSLGSGCDLFRKTNDGKVDKNWYMGLTYQNKAGEDTLYTTKMGDSVAAVALEGEYAGDYAIVKGEEVFVNIDTIKEKIDDRFYWDKNENLVLFTNANEVFTTKVGENEIVGTQSETTEYTISFVEKKKCYLNIKFVTKYIDIKYTFTKKKDDAPAILYLQYKDGEKTYMTVSDDIEMRSKGDYQNLIVTNVAEDTKVEILETGKNWDKVCTDTGYIGYLPVSYLEDAKKEKITYKNDSDTYTHVLMDKKVCMVWNQVYNQTANNQIGALTANVKGVNVISPTWFSLVDKRANLSSLADLDYVETAHNKGMQVWALVDDFKNKKITGTVLSNTSLRQRLVNNIMYFIDSYDLDGINIDFEYISKNVGDSYLQFLRELSIECRKAQKVLSIDNYVPSEWSSFYDIPQQGLLADYIIIMNYDEHTVGSTEAGSVASMPFVENSIKDTLALVNDKNRIINGMPFYTRLWTLTPANGEGEQEGTYVEDAVNGDYYLTSEALGMSQAKKAYKQAGVKPSFDEATGQNFVTYETTQGEVMMWLEDATSVKARLDLMTQYELGGAACWSLGRETDNIWNVMAPYFE